MSPSGAEVIRKIRSEVEEVDPSDVKATLSNGNGIVLLDVRESDEWDAGHLPGAKHIPRGYLESRVEGVVGSDREHAQGAARLRGCRVDERRHHAVEGPRLRRRGPRVTEQGAARALLAPPARAGDRARGP